jgi:hypothetical protein
MTLERKLTLHIGQTKSGSTAIQNYLDAQRPALLGQGVLFPVSVFRRQNPFDADRTPGHLGLIEGLQAVDLAKFEAELTSQPHERLILSVENLFVDQPDGMLYKIGIYFEDWNVRIVAVLRDLQGWLRSRYVEEVMSGFRSSSQTFEDFCADKTAAGVHDYASRLTDLARLLRASDVRVINYNTALQTDGIVPVFLEVTGLPVTDAPLARSIRANVRERHWFMVEAKRRVNHVAQALPLPARLELESTMREQARTIAAALDTPPAAFDPKVPLSETVCHEIVVSNQRLLAEFSLSSPLTNPAAHTAERWSHRHDWPGVDNLVSFGLKTVARLARRHKAGSGPDASSHCLGIPGSELVIDLLQDARVSLHIDSPDTALWAGCYAGRLPILMAVPDGMWLQDNQFLTMKLPSDIVCCTDEQMLTRAVRRRSPTVVVATETSVKRIAMGFEVADKTAVLALLGHAPAEALTIAEELGLFVGARFEMTSVLMRRDGPLTGIET